MLAKNHRLEAQASIPAHLGKRKPKNLLSGSPIKGFVIITNQ
jgi:hypothetical protein